MSLSQILEKNYSFTLEKIFNSNSNVEKRECITELITNLKGANVVFSQRELANCLHVSRQLIKSILDMLLIKSNPFLYLYYLVIIKFLIIETRGRKKFEEKYPQLVTDIEEICENTKHIDKSLKGEIIYTDVTLWINQKEIKRRKGYEKYLAKM